MDTPTRRRTAVHEAAARWRDRCLLRDHSLFIDEFTWTQSALIDLHTRYTGHPLGSSEPFLQKLRRQLLDAPPHPVWIAAEMLYVMYLFPAARLVNGDAKRAAVREVWSWTGSPLPDYGSLLPVLDSGIGHPGSAYLTKLDAELEYLMNVALRLKAGTPPAQSILSDPWGTANFLERVPGGNRRPLRHILLHLLFPEVFPGIVSRTTREQIIRAFRRYLTAPEIPPAPGDTKLIRGDWQVYHIRERLESELGREIDFFDEDVRAQWDPEASASAGRAAGKGANASGGIQIQSQAQAHEEEEEEEEEEQEQEHAQEATPASPPPAASTLARLLHDHIGGGLTLQDDQLRVVDEVKALCSVLMAGNSRPPISVGLFGDWGTGKSFFMELMHAYVEKLAEASREAPPEKPSVFCSHVVQIRFNAWHYMDSNLWASVATRVFEGLSEHVSRHTTTPADAEEAKKRLFEQLATSEGILSQVRAERETANAELAVAQTARRSAQQDVQQAAADRNTARGEREQAQQDQADLQAKIDGLAVDRRALEEKLGRSVSVVVGAALEEARQDPKVHEALNAAAAELGIEPERLQVDEVRQVLRQMRGVGGRLRALGMALGSPKQRMWRVGAVVFVLASVAVVAAAVRWLGGMQEAGAVAAAVVAASGTVAAAVEKWLGRLQRGIGAVERANTLIQGRVDAGTAAFRKEEEEARKQLAELAETERQALAAERAARDDERRALEAERTAREIEQMARAEHRAAEAAELQAQQRVNAVQTEIAELRAGRRLQSFIQERSGTAEYRQHLGLVSTIRKDFEKLSTLLTAAGQQGPEQGLPQIQRIVLYIDDLDRCPENRVVEVLQAVHLLLAFELFIVVVGVDSRWLLRSLEDHYAALRGGEHRNGGDRSSTPQNYLEKIFQIPFTLRRMESDGFGRLMEKGLTVRPPVMEDGKGSADNVGGGMTNAMPPSPSPGEQATLTGAGGTERTGDDPGDEDEAEHEDQGPPIDVAPPGLEIEEWELTYLTAMHPLIGSPRSAKRFVNIYQFIRARLDGEQLERFRGTAKGGEYQVAAMLLAALIGYPRECQRLFEKLLDPADKTSSWWTLVTAACSPTSDPPAAGEDPDEAQDRARLAAAFTAVKKVFTAEDAAKPFRDWAPVIKRFSFHFTP